MNSKLVCALVIAGVVGGCASTSDKVAATYVSPMQYESYNCQQLGEEAQRISARAAQASGAQDSQATKDTVATTAAIIIFWPAAFFVQGDKQNAAELARLKGELEAVEQVSIRKQCGIQFRRGPMSYAPN
jgi:outer membrane lipoprotein-sorting protein